VSCSSSRWWQFAPLLIACLVIALLHQSPVTAQDPRSRQQEEELPPPWEEGLPEEEQEAPPEESEDAESMAAPPRLDRISFEIPFPPEKGGGVAVGTAGHLEYVREDYVVASGGVELRFRDFTFQGERIAVDLREEQITGEGDIIMDQGPRRVVGDTLFFDLNTETGTLTNAKAYVDPDIFFEGKQITRLSETRYRVVDGTLTSCIDDSPDWNFRLSRGEVELEGFAKIKHGRFRVKKLPLLYSPYLLYPAKSERSSGFLFPNLGYNHLRGAYLGLAWFQTLGDSYDTTIFADFYGQDYQGFGNEWRYRPSESTTGFFEGYVINDPEVDDVRWKVFWAHVSDNLPLGFRGVVFYQDFSDFDFFRDFERDFNNATIRRLFSSGHLTSSWGQSSVIMQVDQLQTFLNNGDITTQRRQPEVEYRLRATQIGRLPVYIDLLSSVNNLVSERTDKFSNQWQRADVFPQITASLSTLPWLSWSVTGGGRATYYSQTFEEETGEFVGDALTRTFASARSAIVGPSFSRVYNKGVGPFAKFKHIIEPRWNYAYIGDFEEQNLIPRFDEVDVLRPSHLVSYNFINRLLAKPRDEIEGGGAREIMSLEIGQLFSLDEDRPLQSSGDFTQTTTTGPLNVRYRFNPSRQTSLEAKLNHNTLFGHLNNASLTGAVGIGGHGVGLTWFTRFNAEQGETTGNQIRFFTGINLWPNKLRLDAQVNYDFQLSLLQGQRYIFQYFSQCYGLRFEFREFKTFDRTDRDFRFAVTLKNIGTFLDLTGGTSTGFNPRF